MRISCSLLAALMVGLTACTPKGESKLPPKLNDGRFLGIWLEKDEAIELRTTGKLESLCPEIKQDPDSVFMNIRLVDTDGSVYLYNPDGPNNGIYPEAKMGVIANSGVMTLGPQFKPQAGIETANVVFADASTLRFDYGSGMAMDYSRSDATEARAYFAAQKACVP